MIALRRLLVAALVVVGLAACSRGARPVGDVGGESPAAVTAESLEEVEADGPAGGPSSMVQQYLDACTAGDPTTAEGFLA